MRVRLEFDDIFRCNLSSNRTWYFIDLANIGTILNLQHALVSEFGLCHSAESLELELKGFRIPRKLNVSSIIKENDLIKVKCTSKYLEFLVTELDRKRARTTDWELDSAETANSKKTKLENLQNKAVQPSKNDQKEQKPQKIFGTNELKTQLQKTESITESNQLHLALPESKSSLSELSETVELPKSYNASEPSELPISSSESFGLSSSESSSSESPSSESSSSESSSFKSSSKSLKTSKSARALKKKPKLSKATETNPSLPYESLKSTPSLCNKTSLNVPSFNSLPCADSCTVEKSSKDTFSTPVQFEHLIFDDDGLPHTIPFKNKTGSINMGRYATSSKKKRYRNLKQKISLPEEDSLINTSRVYIISPEQDENSLPTDYNKLEKADLKTLEVGDLVACTFNCLTPELVPGVSPWRRGYVVSKSENMDMITLDLLPCGNVNELYWFDDNQKPIKSIYDWATEWGVEVSVGKTDIAVDGIADMRVVNTKKVSKNK